MRTFAKFLMVSLVGALAAACGGDDDDDGVGMPDANTQLDCVANGGADCFELPTEALQAWNGTALATPNFNCSPVAPANSTGTVSIAGKIEDFQTSDPKNGAMIFAYDSLDFTASPTAMATSAPDGTFSLTLPTGTPNIMNFKVTASDALDTYTMNLAIDIMNGETGFTRGSVSVLTADAVSAFVGVTRDPANGVLAGVVTDCDGNAIANAIATVASTSSSGGAAPPQFVPGPKVYYFAGRTADPDLPVRRTSTKATQDDGLFVVLDIPPTSGSTHYFLQVWGFRTAADVAMGTAGLSLISELEAPVVANSVISAEMPPTEGQ